MTAKIAKSCLRQWTFEAMMCYKIQGNCSRCPNSKLETPCQMRKIVKLLLQKFGLPPSYLRSTNGKIGGRYDL